jgi:uncharacterized protein YbjT (DUF2867 family)
MRVLAVGATGQFAGLVVPTLVSRGVQVTAFAHDPAKQDRAGDAGADEAIAGDLRDPASVRAARGGVDGVFLIIRRSRRIRRRWAPGSSRSSCPTRRTPR